jgi:ASC-1-like (ASCH) protein
MQVGDILKINSRAEYKIIAKNQYKKFAEMIATEGIKNVIPDKETVAEAVGVYYQFFSKEDEERCGVVAVKIAPTGS